MSDSSIASEFASNSQAGDRARNVDNKARFILLVVTIVMLLNSTAVLILDIEYILLQIPILGFNPPNAKIMRLLPNMKIAGNFLERLNVSISVIIINLFGSPQP